MKTVEDYAEIRKAYFIEGKSIQQIHRALGVARETVRKALIQPDLPRRRAVPVLFAYSDETVQLFRKQSTTRTG